MRSLSVRARENGLPDAEFETALGDVLALMGDKVDNVPGIPGIGPKTASQLIAEFGSLEAVLAATESITKPKLKQSLIEHADAARLSRKLVELVCDAKLPQPLEELALKNIPPEPLKEFLEEQGFKALLNRLTGGLFVWLGVRLALAERN